MSYVKAIVDSNRFSSSTIRPVSLNIREIKNNNICNIINVGKSCDFLIKLDHKSIQI